MGLRDYYDHNVRYDTVLFHLHVLYVYTISHLVVDRGCSPYWYSTSSLTEAGLLNSKSVPTLVLGNAITSRMDWAWQRIAMRRSKPESRGEEKNAGEIVERSFNGIFEGDRQDKLTQSNAPMRWCATFEGVQQVIKWCFLRLSQLIDRSINCMFHVKERRIVANLKHFR